MVRSQHSEWVILGFSGLSKAPGFKRQRLPGLDEREYAIFQGADAAAAVVAEGRVVAAAAEERFDGTKHSAAFPAGAAKYCLAAANVNAASLDLVAHSFSYGPVRNFYMGQSGYYRELFEQVLDPELIQAEVENSLGVELGDKFLPVPHHLAHAASAYNPSGFRDALVLVSDGLGERNSATAYVARPGHFEVVAEVPAHDSLGLLYGLFTLYLGFAFGDGEYKVMGLAPLGDPSRFIDTILRDMVHLDLDGRYRVPLLLENRTDLDKETYRPAIEALEKEFGPRRNPGDAIEQHHKDVAAGLQAALQQAQLHLLAHLQRRTGQSRLCLAGGVGLNCVANGVILRSRLFDDVFVQPAAGDDGAALGAALYAAEVAGSRPQVTAGPLFGPAYSADECRRVAERLLPGHEIVHFSDEEPFLQAIAELIDAGKIIGWFQGRMEFGPRALGNRSILADPRRAEMRTRINALVKKR